MPEQSQLRTLGVLTLALAAAWSTIAMFTVDASRHENALELPGPDASDLRRLMPQGWSFFTRDPREPDFDILVHDGETWKTLFDRPNFAAKHYFGWSRKPRGQGVEAGTIAQTLGEAGYTECKGPVDACAEGLKTHRTIRNPSPNPTLCGEALVMHQAPVPWAWLGSSRPVTMPSRILKVSIEC